MKIVNKFNNLKTWQKLSIGIALLTIFKYLTMGSIFLEVKAESKGTCEPYITNPITGLPENVSLSKTTNGTYITNLDPSELNIVNGKWQGWGDYYYQLFGARTQNNQITQFDQSNLQNIGGNVPLYNNYITRFEITDWNYNMEMGPIHPNTDYTIVLEIIGGSGTTISNIDAYKTSDFAVYLEGRYMQYNYNNAISLGDYYSIKNVSWTTCIDTGGEVANDRGYLILKIKTNELLPQPNGGLYIKSLSIGMLNIDELTGQPKYQVGSNIDNDFKYLIKSDNTSNVLSMKRLWLIMDGDIAIGNEDAEFITGQLVSNQIYEKCDTLDIACHVRNIQRGIENFGKNILYSLKSLFSYIFIPDFDFINDYIDETNQMLTEKYPDIQAFEDYIEYFNGRLNNLSRQTTISFPGVKWPFDESIQLIPAFTYDFSTIINDNRIAPYYTIGRIVIIAMISIWWGIYLINWLKSILHNTPKIDM